MLGDRIVVATLPVVRQNFHRRVRLPSGRVVRLQATAEVSLRDPRQSSANHAIQTSQSPNLLTSWKNQGCDRVFLPLRRATHLPADWLPHAAGYVELIETLSIGIPFLMFSVLRSVNAPSSDS